MSEDVEVGYERAQIRHTWDGRERRASCQCEYAETMDRRLLECKAEVDAEISVINQSVTALSKEVHGLRGDVHRMTESVKSMQYSLETIAETMTKMASLPETWANLMGFWRVIRWIKDNFIPAGAVIAVIGYAAYLGAKATGLIN